MFWGAMRTELWWQEDVNAEYQDFYTFWEMFHGYIEQDYDFQNDYYDYQDPNCYWRDINAFCDDFQFINDECRIYASYNPCVTDHFICESYSYDEYGNEQMSPCDEDFEDVQFWTLMRDEMYWAQHEEYADFYNFWEMYHFADNTGACEDKYFMGDCNEFNMIEESCQVLLMYNTCDETSFVCELTSYTDYDYYGNQAITDCTEDFTDYFFWSQMRAEPFWEANQEYADFWMFWENYHFGSDDYGNMDDYDTWGDDYDTWGDDDDWGNWDDYDMNCDVKNLEVFCSDFTMFEGDECNVMIEYSPCVTETSHHFVCIYNGYDEYEGQYSRDCTMDFEDADFWAQLSQEEWWFQDINAEYMDFYMFWNSFHIQEDPCEWKDIMVSCNEFTFTDDDCSAFIQYSPCDETHFVCELSELNEYNEYEITDCTSDFEDFEFWSVMREEEWWMRPENEQYQDFYHFWNAFHYGGANTDCEDVEIEAFCADFEMFAEDECAIQMRYNPCDTTGFFCEYTDFDDYGNQQVNDCQEDFLNEEFWAQIRQEAFWFENELFDFYEFWEDYHYGEHPDQPECDEPMNWLDIMCADIQAMPEDVEDCRIEIGYSSCDFECSIRRPDDMGNAEDCTHNFKETDWWNVAIQEPVLQGEQFQEIMGYWASWHAAQTVHCEWQCDDMDCAAAYELEMCVETSCFNTCDQDYMCHVDYVWEGETGFVSCHDFMEYTQGNSTDGGNCEQRDVYARCSDFAFIRAQMDEDPDMQDCNVFLSYNPCVTDTFMCELTQMNDYGINEYQNCEEDFEDGEFWAQMRQEDFWMERELYDFYMFWEEFHGHVDPENCDWKEFTAECNDFSFHTDESGLDENCDVYVSYSPCEDDYFICTLTMMTDYGMETQPCDEDFQDADFWMVMREENFWNHPEMEQYYDFYMFWDEYHMGGDHDDYDMHCEDREIYGYCMDFEMFEANGECEWTIMYNSCPEREIMTCVSFSLDEYQEMQTYDCMEDFLDADFWHEFRNEEWWTREENAVHMELWQFWDSYHMNSGDDYHNWEPDYEDCEWKEYNLRCSDFESEDHDDYDYYMMDMDYDYYMMDTMDYDYDMESDCDIFLYYNPCVTDYFECEYRMDDADYEMWEDCTDEFTDAENW